MHNVQRFFPLLAKSDIHYLDNGSTTQKPATVIAAVKEFYTEDCANIHRGLYPLSEEATARYEKARETIAAFVNAPSKNIIFTSGTTESINLVANGWGREHLQEGDEILLTPLEHHANILPWLAIAKEKGATIVYCDLTPNGEIDVKDLKAKMSEKTKLLAITHISNVLGSITPLEEIIPIAKERGIIVLVDGAQAVPHMRIDLAQLQPDFYAFSGHKMFGPTGIGILYIAEDHFDMQPGRLGGDMIDDVKEQEAVYARGETRRFEAGTPNLAGAIGLGAAIDFLQQQEMDVIERHDNALLKKAWVELEAIEGVTLHGPHPNTGRRSSLLTFTLEQVPPHDVAQVLADNKVYIRSGKHCAHPLHYRLKLPEGSNRAVFALYNTEADVTALVDGVKQAIKLFGGSA